jgi:hypothetical protein
MKKTIRVAVIYASLAFLIAPALTTAFEATAQAQTPAATTGQCTDENKGVWYGDFTKLRTVDATKAYDAAKKYLAACPTEEGQIPAYLKKWVAAYEKEARKLKLNDLFLNQRKYAEAMTLAKEILNEDPEYLPAIMDLGYGGYVLAVTTKNESGNAEAVNYAKKAIQAIEAGKTVENWAPFKSKDDALGYLYYSNGYLLRESNPSESLNNFLKAGRFEGEIKKNSQTYAFIAASYEKEYERQSLAYEATYKDKAETPESKLAVANINQLVDRIIDALARAVAVAGTDAAGQASKTQWMARLTELYKFRHGGTDTGLTELIATVLTKPLPAVPTPLTELPAGTPSTSAAPASGGATTTSAAVPVPAKTGGTTTLVPANATAATTTSNTTANNTKPAAKPKTRNNHRRH